MGATSPSPASFCFSHRASPSWGSRIAEEFRESRGEAGDFRGDARRGYLRDWLHFGGTSDVASTPVENAPDLTGRGRSHFLEHETGLEPATPTLAREDENEEPPPLTL